MRNNSSMVYSFLLIMADFTALLAAFTIAYIIRVQFDPRPLVEQITALSFITVFVTLLPFWLVVFALLGLYNKNTYERRIQEYSRLFMGSVIGIMGIITYDFASSRPIFPARLVPVYALVAGYGLLVLFRAFLRACRSILFRYGIGINRVILIGNSPLNQEFMETLRHTKTSGYHIIGYQTDKPITAAAGIAHYKTLSEALSAISAGKAHTVIQTELFTDEINNQQVINAAQTNHVAFKFVPANNILFNGNNELELFHNFPVISVHQTALIGWGRIGKRLFDVIGSSIGLIIATPILAVFGVIIKITDPSYPIIYRDRRRVTRFGTPFTTYKLRSIYGRYSPGLGGGKKSEVEIFKEMGRDDLARQWQTNHKVDDDPRIMPIGRFIRKTSIDELPQLWNVLKGDLSLIGPRPVPKDELKRYADSSSLFLSVKPGITGLWQVSGRNEISYDERIALELYYVQNWSFLLDLKIIYRTLLVMIGGKGQ